MTTSPVALVTGGGRSMGRLMSLALARDGYDIVIAGPEEEEGRKTAAEIEALGRRSLTVLTDVSQEPAVEKMARAARDTLGRIDVLVNNAGIVGPTALVAAVNRHEWDEVLAVNLTGAFLCCKYV